MQYDEVKELIDIFEKSDLNDMELKLDNAVIRLNRGPVSPWIPTMPAAPMTGNVQPASVVGANQSSDNVNINVKGIEKSASDQNDSSDNSKFVKAPIVGTYYESSAPDQAPYVEVGDEISEGDVVCIIEAMKFMNEVTSEVSGKVVEILVEDGQFVEYGQPLLRVE